MRRGGSVSGAVSLVMIVCVLCLAVFATLTYATADRERKLAELTAARAAEYYAADAEAVRTLAALQRGETPDIAITEPDFGVVSFTVPINDTQQLRVRAELLDGTCTILDWSTAFSGDWETEDTIEIWDGDFFAD